MPPHVAVRAVKVLSDALDKMGKGTDARIELELALFTLCQPQEARIAQPAAVAARPQGPEVPQQPAARPFAAVAAPVARRRKLWKKPRCRPRRPWPNRAGQKTGPRGKNRHRRKWPRPAHRPKRQAQQPQPAPEQPAAGLQHTPARVEDFSPKPAPLQETAAVAQQPSSAKPTARAGAPGELVPFAQWPQVIAAMQEKDQLLYANLKGDKGLL